jgi:hypothetical protein
MAMCGLVWAPALAIAQMAGGDLALHAGVWTGFYQPPNSERVKATFIVKEDETEPGMTLTIQLALEPREKFKFTAEDLQIDSTTVKFRFGREGSLRQCELQKNEDTELVGRCASVNGDENASRSQMMMRPPVEDGSDE